MFIRPQTLSLITTHQCTAACDHCCFTCTPQATKAIPIARLERLIDEAAQIRSMQVVVFTGGECFLLGRHLDRLIARATALGLATRCVTNGYWGRGVRGAARRVVRLVDAGLKEINFSTGTFHARWVPTQHVANAAQACAEAGLTTIINAEISAHDMFDIDVFTRHPTLGAMIEDGRVSLQRNVWIPHAEGHGEADLSPLVEASRFAPGKRDGCSTVLNVLAVTPDQKLVACCGLHLESIPDLHLGSVADRTLQEAVNDAPDDFLKIWMHVDGPERILEFVAEHEPNYSLPLDSTHPCTTCLHLYRDPVARRIIAEHYHEVVQDVVARWMTELATTHLNRELMELDTNH